MASDKMQLSLPTTPQTPDGVPLSPIGPKIHKKKGQAADSGSLLSSEKTAWKWKYKKSLNEPSKIKDNHGHSVMEIKRFDKFQPNFELVDLQTGATTAKIMVSEDRSHAELSFDDVVYATLKRTSRNTNQWGIETPTTVYKIRPSPMIKSNFEILIGPDEVAKLHHKPNFALIEIEPRQDIPFILTCCIFIDLLSRISSRHSM